MGSLFQEIKRRKVFRVAAIYAVVAWVLIQVADTIAPLMNLPESAPGLVLFMLIILFPIALFLAWAYEVTPDGVRADTGVQAANTPVNSTDRKLIYAILVLVLLVAGFQVTDRFFLQGESNTIAVDGSALENSGSASDLSRRFLIDIGVTQPITGPGVIAEIALSADGRRLVYGVQRPQEPVQLYIQELDQLEARQLPGTEFASTPFFSPDGEWIGFGSGFGSGGALSKISIQDGPPQLLADSGRPGTGGFWSADDTIIYPSNIDDGIRLQRLPATGGVPEPVEADRGNSAGHTWPWLLPDEDALLYSVRPAGGLIRDGRVDLLIQSTGNVKTLIQNGYNARYVPTNHIAFMRAGSLWAVPFDLDRLETIGPEVLVIQAVHTSSVRGNAAYAISDDGLLIYLPGEDVGDVNSEPETLVWVDRNGNEEELSLRRDYRSPSVSPDGQRIAVASEENGNYDIWVYDLVRDNLSRLTFDEGLDHVPLWTPDGERIVFSSQRDDGGLWWQAADGSGRAESLLTGAAFARPTSFTPDGSQLVYDYEGDLYLLTLSSDSPPEILLQTDFTEARSVISPDGRWIAYESDRTGQVEIYVGAFPDVEEGGLWLISNQGGHRPKWSPDGREIFYIGTDGLTTVWSAQVETETSFQHDTPVLLFSGNYLRSLGGNGGAFDVSIDGTRFLLTLSDFLTPSTESSITHLVAVENWFAELKRLAPPDPQ